MNPDQHAGHVAETLDAYSRELVVGPAQHEIARDALAALRAGAAAADTLADALHEAGARAREILDVLDSGNEPLADSGYGYEHMCDMARDVRPLCEALVAAYDAATKDNT